MLRSPSFPSPALADGGALPLSAGAQARHRRLRVGAGLAHPQSVGSAPPAQALNLPGVWRADACARPTDSWSTGYAALDTHLPGGGWPAGGLGMFMWLPTTARVPSKWFWPT